MRTPAEEIKNFPASFGAGGGEIINDTELHKGPFCILKAQGSDAVIASGSLPGSWGTSVLDGITISNGDYIVIAGMKNITLTSGTLLAYFHSDSFTR